MHEYVCFSATKPCYFSFWSVSSISLFLNKVQFFKVSPPPQPSPGGVPRTSSHSSAKFGVPALARIPGSSPSPQEAGASPRSSRPLRSLGDLALPPDPEARASAPPPLPDARAARGAAASAHRRARPAIGFPGCPSPPPAPLGPVGRFCRRSRSPGGWGAAREDGG